MGRRKSDGDRLLDGLFHALLAAPWLLGPCIAAAVYLVFRFLVPMLLANLPVTGLAKDVSQLPYSIFGRISIGMAPLLAGIVVVVWLVAEYKKLARRRMFDAQSSLGSIKQLSWQDFEALLAEAYRRQGYAVEVTGNSTGDGGIDIVLRRRSEKRLVQCKQWLVYQVGVKPVRELLGVVTAERVAGGILITSGGFTAEARRFAEGTVIELIDGAALEKLIGSLVKNNERYRADAHMKIGPKAGATPDDHPRLPSCPKCGAVMVLRTARKDGSHFWGCSQFSTQRCTGTRPTEARP